MNKTILLIAGGHNQVSLAQEIINQGYNLILVDPNLESPCSRYAHTQLVHDTRFYLDILKSIKEQNLVIDGVVSDQSDAALKSVSMVAYKLGLIHKNISFINNSLSKANQYSILSKNKIKVPKTYQCSLGQEKIFIEKSDDILNFSQKSYVLKPADSQGSKGVYIINSKSELEIYLTNTFKESKIGLVLLQDFVEGREYSIDGLISKGKFYPLVCGSKFHYINNQCIDERNTFINDVEEEILKKLINETESAAISLGFQETLLHAELIFCEDKNEAFVIEISPRGGGGSISSKIVPYITEFNSNKFIIDTCLGEKNIILPSENIIFNQTKYVIMRFLPERLENFSKITIDNPINSELIHLDIPLSGAEGTKVYDSRSRLGYWVIANNNISQLLEDEKYMLKSIKFLK